MNIESKKIEIDYCNQIFEIDYFFRPGQKETIVYLHGLGCSKSDFFNAIEQDSLKAYSLLSFDFPGHDGSNYPETIGMNDLVEITNKVLKKLDIQWVILIGHSMGGIVGLLFAMKYIEKVKAFINIEGNLIDEDCFFTRKIVEGGYEKFKSKTFRDFKQSLAKRDNTGARKYAENLKSVLPKSFWDYSESMVEITDDADLLQKFVSLKIPKLFIYGSENNKLSYIPKLKENKIETSEIVDSNHFPQFDNPIMLYDVIFNFLKKI